MSFAQLNGDGYYRVENDKTKRYIYVTDNKSDGINISTTSADLNAIQLFMGFERASSDPATVCYIKNVGGDKYDIQAQGTGVYEIISHYIAINKRGNVYMCSATASGMTKYLGDQQSLLDIDEGVISTETTGDFRNWNIHPITTSDNSFFGVKPTVSKGSTHYAPYYTSFPYSFAGTGMKAMYITKVDNGMAVYKEMTGTIPAETPVIIVCSSDKPIDNKLNIGGTGTALSDNVMKGNYFCRKKGNDKHNNFTPYDPNTMRLLGVMSNGEIGFIKSTVENIPANSSYIVVPAGSPDEFKLVNEEEYKEQAAKEPTAVTLDKTSLELTEDEETTLVATIAPTTAVSTLTWTSSNTAVATVSETGVVKAIAAGSATITVTTANNLKAECAVTVKSKVVLVESITLNRTAIEAEEGTEVTLVATVLPANATNKEVSWESSNTSVATVDNNGKVKILAEGKAIISVKATDGSNVSSLCTVTATTGITDITTATTNLQVYSLSGNYLGIFKSVDALKPGAYIINKQKVIVK